MSAEEMPLRDRAGRSAHYRRLIRIGVVNSKQILALSLGPANNNGVRN